MERLGFDVIPDDPVEILAVSGGERQTDTLEVFPKITKAADGSFSCRFFLHGWRHVNQGARERILQLCFCSISVRLSFFSSLLVARCQRRSAVTKVLFA